MAFYSQPLLGFESMNATQHILMRMFGRPRGVPGRLGGIIMAHTNDACGAWVVELLEIETNESVLEVGFGPGVAIKRLSELAGHVTGVDQSREMIAQARARNASAIKSGRVELRHGSADSLPFEDNTFDKAMAVNAMHIWPDGIAGLREMRRVMKSGGTIGLGFTPYSGQTRESLTEKLIAAGFSKAQLVEKDKNFCVLARKHL
jgi:ubiquinone/menaquinone biosynthesis C-methylase UbiE